MTDSRDRIVLAYSGSLASSAAIRWLAEQYAADVVTLTLDFGAGGELQEIHERALAIGAVRAHVVDVREEFADAYLLPALQAGALHPGGDMIDPLARPLIARKLIEIARIERAVAVAHQAAPDSGIDTLIHALAPDMRVIGGSEGPAPGDVAEYARHWNIVVPATAARKSIPARPDNGADVEMTFDRDVPVAINGVPMSLTELIDSLTVIATQHGITGTGDFAGAPALAVLQAAFNARQREETTCVVRLKLQHGATSAAAVPSSDLAAPRS
jgi:argininosuccinate synthase